MQANIDAKDQFAVVKLIAGQPERKLTFSLGIPFFNWVLISRTLNRKAWSL
jgi:hypothetical protein